MKLTVLLPTRVLLNQEVTRIVAEGANGGFCLLPRHIDFVSALVPGLLAFHDLEEKEHFLAIDQGILVKCGDEVSVSVRDAVEGTDLGTLREAVQERFRALSEREKTMRSTMARLEAGLVRQFLEMEKDG